MTRAPDGLRREATASPPGRLRRAADGGTGHRLLSRIDGARACLALAALLFALGLGRDAADRWIDATALPPLAPVVSQEIVDREGQLLRAYPVEDGIWRLATTPDAVDPGFINMLVQVEDKRFWRHAGVDLLALIRAAGQALWHGRIVSGGSTLTMQVARLVENGPTGRWSGKLRQMRLALALERRLSKAQILALYLTHAPYGGNLEGVRAAALAWFGKPPRRLSAEESALLVALPQAPETRRPDRHPEAAAAARAAILARTGHPPTHRPVPQSMRPFPRVAAHLADRARAEEPDLRRTALTVERSLQTRMEALALRAVRDLPPETSAALLVANHQTGEVLAYVGGPSYSADAREGFVDLVRAVRSPGSTLKPLVYALAFDQGLAHPETVIADRPVTFGSYAPQNFDGVFRGDVTVRRALELSLNTPAVQLTHAMGPLRITAALRRAGTVPRLPGEGPPGLAVALGGVGLTLEELVTLYAGLARGGEAVPLRWREEDGEKPARPARIVSRQAAWHVGHVLSGIVPPGGQLRGEIAFKTGTSYGHRDAWALGFDGQHVIGVWLGRPDGTPVPGIFGGDLAAPILFQAFDRLGVERMPLPPPPPEALTVSTARLPAKLQRFDLSLGGDARDQAAVRIAFPPNGARLRPLGADREFALRVEGGTPPFAVLADGRPLRTGLRDRAVELGGFAPGFARVTVVDAAGRSDAVEIRLD